ncbi:MAG: hypothetical protein IT381_19350 [Deltaproteobacteria bacterium]|nr:hypothetical protein [Deltaproteobacteria bacterium]
MRAATALSAIVLLLGACSRIISRPQVNPCDQGQTCRPGYFCDPGQLTCEIATGADCAGLGRTTSCSRNVGECKVGTRTCAQEGYSECSGIMPAAELCDGLDNDCDNAIDETFATLGAPCTVGRGACKQSGVLVCDPSGADVMCSVVPLLPKTETCNGIDDDCDGTVDNNPTGAPDCPKQMGVCAGAHARCVDAAFIACDDAAYGKDYDGADAEQRCDGLDNDCDGAVDEGYVVKAGDLELTELVACPQQTWNDGLDTFTNLLYAGGNGVPFDDVPATVDLDPSKVADQTWFEVENRLACPIAMGTLKFLAGASEGTLAPLVPDASRSNEGGPCTTIGGHGLCVFKGGAAIRGSDSAGFTRIVRLSRMDNTTIDTISATSPGKCLESCRLATVRHQPMSGCCEGESYSVQRSQSGPRTLVQQAATPLWPNDIRTTYKAPLGVPQALGTEIVVSEVFALAGGVDVNGDGVASTQEDAFIELAVMPGRKVDLGRARLIDAARGGDPLLHQFACFAPLDDAHRLLIFGAARGPISGGEFSGATVATSSRTAAIFAPARATAMTIEVETATGGKATRQQIDATGLSGASVQSRMRCTPMESASLACECQCRGQASTCFDACAQSCETPTEMAGCFRPGD